MPLANENDRYLATAATMQFDCDVGNLASFRANLAHIDACHKAAARLVGGLNVQLANRLQDPVTNFLTSG
jgi:hypothetical protein